MSPHNNDVSQIAEALDHYCQFIYFMHSLTPISSRRIEGESDSLGIAEERQAE